MTHQAFRLAAAEVDRLRGASALVHRQVPVDELAIANRFHAPMVWPTRDTSAVPIRAEDAAGLSGRIKPPGLVYKGVIRPISVQQRVECTNQPADGALRSRKLARRREDQAVMPTPTDDDGPMDLDKVGDVFGHQRSALSCGVREQLGIEEPVKLSLRTGGDDVMPPAAQLASNLRREMFVQQQPHRAMSRSRRAVSRSCSAAAACRASISSTSSGKAA